MPSRPLEIASEGGDGIVSHGVDNAEQAAREGDAGDALGVVHVGEGLMVALIGHGQPLDDLADCVQRVAVGVHGAGGGDVGLDGMGQRVHAGVSAELSGHGVGELGVDDGDVGRDVEVGQRVLDALLVVGDDGERGDLGRGTGGRGDGAEVGLAAELREGEGYDGLLEGLLGILVEQPHGLGGVDGRAAADADEMGEPPPMPMIQSGWKASMALAPFITVSTDGSDSTPSKISTSKPASLRSASTSCRKPPRRIEPPPVTIMARSPLRFLTS